MNAILESIKTIPRLPSKISPAARAVISKIGVGLVVAYLGCAGFIWWSMQQPPETFARAMSKMPGPVPFLLFPFETMWTQARAGSLHLGDPAPDFSLLKLDKGERLQLSSLNKQGPVVLVFGSYT